MTYVFSLSPKHILEAFWFYSDVGIESLRLLYRQNTYGITCGLIIIGLAFFGWILLFPLNKQDALHDLQALASVVTPAGSKWPTRYTAFSRKKSISIPLSVFLGDIISGDLQIRSASDLSRMLLDKHTAYDMRLSFDIDSTVSLRFSRLYFGSQLFLRSANGPSSSPVTLYKQPHSCLNLDIFHQNTIERKVAYFISQIKFGKFAALEFSTIAPDISYSKPAFTFCALPFLPRQYAPHDPRTLAPLHISLARIIELVQKNGATISALYNTSTQMSDLLTSMEDILTEDKPSRCAYIAKYGMKGWREYCLMLTWEAALLNAKLMRHWIVVFHR